MAKIVWKDSTFATTKGLDVSAVLDQLEEIRTEGGLIKPSAVVQAAEPKSSPLHPAFEWRNGIAAQRYREWQARQLIRAVRVVNEETGQDRPAYIAITVVAEDGRHDRGYQKTEIAISRPDEWLSALEIFNSKIQSSRRSLDELERIAGSHHDRDRLAAIAIAAKALETARVALTH